MYKILIVEDDFIIAKELKNHLKQWQYDAECITDLEGVVNQYNTYKPHLILLDISLPFLMDFIGVVKYEKFPMFQSFFYLQPMTI